MMIEKIIVVAPTTAVPISTGLAVALKVLPAPSFSSSSSLASSKFGVKPKSRLSSCFDAGDLLDRRTARRPTGRCRSPGRSCPPRW